jgi:hypothetical protein
VDPRSIFPEQNHERFKRAKATYDPTNMFLANHAIALDDVQVRQPAGAGGPQPNVKQ